jgi:ABC-2 type transport system ATP-binding protein
MLIDIANLRLSRNGVRILDDVHLKLEEGEIYGLLGPNGAGKSTTIAAAIGLLEREGGRVHVLGHDPAAESRLIYPKLGVLPEHGGFYDWMTATAYLEFFAELLGRGDPLEAATSRLAEVGLTPRTGQKIATFSHGMRQRLGLARCLIGDPALLILDEPTNGLDPRGRREIHDILRALARRGVGVLLCTHLLDDVERLCDRVGIIVAGRTVAEGRIADVVRAAGYATRFRLRLNGDLPAKAAAGRAAIVACAGEWCTVDIDPAATPDAVWRELMFAGWPIAEIQRERSGLEELYLSLTERSAA